MNSSTEVRPEIETAVVARHRTCAFLRALIAESLGIDPREIAVRVESIGTDTLYLVGIPKDASFADPATLESVVYLWLRRDKWARTLRVLPWVKDDGHNA